MSYPNQLFTISQKQKCEKDFVQISNKAWINAHKNLTGAAFAMWLWLISNSSTYRNELSRAAFINEFGYNGKTYEKVWRELKQKGYAVLKEGSKNTYLILEEPIKKNIPLPEEGDNNSENNPLLQAGVSPSYNREHPLPEEGVSPSCNGREIDKHIIDKHIDGSLHSSASQSNEVRSTPKPPKGASPRVEEKVRGDLIEITMAELRAMAQQGLNIEAINKEQGLFRGNGVIYKVV